jgi:hypothetical protein
MARGGLLEDPEGAGVVALDLLNGRIPRGLDGDLRGRQLGLALGLGLGLGDGFGLPRLRLAIRHRNFDPRGVGAVVGGDPDLAGADRLLGGAEEVGERALAHAGALTSHG